MQGSDSHRSPAARAQAEFALSVGSFGFFAFSLLMLMGPLTG